MSDKIQSPERPSILELIQEYGSLNDPRLTDSTLAGLGYVRMGPGRIVSIVHQEAMRAAAEEQERAQEDNKRLKEDHIPFDSITFSAKRSRIGRSDVSEADLAKIVSSFRVNDEIGDAIEEAQYETIKPHGGYVEGLKAGLQILYTNNPGINVLLDALFSTEVQRALNIEDRDDYEGLIGYLLLILLTNISEKIQNTLAQPLEERTQERKWDTMTLEGQGGDVIRFRQQWSEKENDELERAKAKLADPDFYEPEFQKLMASLDSDRVSKMGFNNLFEFARSIFEIACRKTGFDDIADRVRAARDIAAMRNLSRQALPSAIEERELGARMRNMTIEEKKAASTQISELKLRRRKEQAMLSGIEQYFSLPQRLADIARRRISKAQDAIMLGGKTDERIEFKLIGTPDTELDRDPGKVSGDCTDGYPLPFDEPSLLLYNVKVFNVAKQHIGNIYLFETTVEEGGEKQAVWHLDAIQIPANIDWSEGIENLFESLKSAARAKNIPFISISDTESRISNYNYIADAVMAYIEKNEAHHAALSGIRELPEYRGKSRLQTEGPVYLIQTGIQSGGAEGI